LFQDVIPASFVADGTDYLVYNDDTNYYEDEPLPFTLTLSSSAFDAPTDEVNACTPSCGGSFYAAATSDTITATSGQAAPEPRSGGLFVLGFLGLLGVRRLAAQPALAEGARRARRADFRI